MHESDVGFYAAAREAAPASAPSTCSEATPPSDLSDTGSTPASSDSDSSASNNLAQQQAQEELEEQEERGECADSMLVVPAAPAGSEPAQPAAAPAAVRMPATPQPARAPTAAAALMAPALVAASLAKGRAASAKGQTLELQELFRRAAASRGAAGGLGLGGYKPLTSRRMLSVKVCAAAGAVLGLCCAWLRSIVLIVPLGHVGAFCAGFSLAHASDCCHTASCTWRRTVVPRCPACLPPASPPPHCPVLLQVHDHPGSFEQFSGQLRDGVTAAMQQRMHAAGGGCTSMTSVCVRGCVNLLMAVVSRQQQEPAFLAAAETATTCAGGSASPVAKGSGSVTPPAGISKRLALPAPIKSRRLADMWTESPSASQSSRGSSGGAGGGAGGGGGGVADSSALVTEMCSLMSTLASAGPLPGASMSYSVQLGAGDSFYGAASAAGNTMNTGWTSSDGDSGSDAGTAAPRTAQGAFPSPPPAPVRPRLPPAATIVAATPRQQRLAAMATIPCPGAMSSRSSRSSQVSSGVFRTAANAGLGCLPLDPADSVEDMMLVPELPAFDHSKVAAFAAPVCAVASEEGSSGANSMAAQPGQQEQQQEGQKQVVWVVVTGLAGFTGQLRLVAFADGCVLVDQAVAKNDLRQDVLRWAGGGSLRGLLTDDCCVADWRLYRLLDWQRLAPVPAARLAPVMAARLAPVLAARLAETGACTGC
jgi:hypothetical protein